MLNKSGIDFTKEKYYNLKSGGLNNYIFSENKFNAFGYRLIRSGQVKGTIGIFKLNGDVYSESWNTYDSLGEAYINNGQAKLAIKNYKKSLSKGPSGESFGSSGKN